MSTHCVKWWRITDWEIIKKTRGRNREESLFHGWLMICSLTESNAFLLWRRARIVTLCPMPTFVSVLSELLWNGDSWTLRWVSYSCGEPFSALSVACSTTFLMLLYWSACRPYLECFIWKRQQPYLRGRKGAKEIPREWRSWRGEG